MTDRGAGVLVTGATGFIGRAVLTRLSIDERLALRAAVRHSGADLPARAAPVLVSDLGPDTHWAGAVSGIEVVIHAAARVHKVKDAAHDSLSDYRRINVDGTLRLARSAAAAGVRRFVFISSIKVNGENTSSGCPFRADDNPAPVDAYGISKFEAEEGLRRVASETGMQLVIIRPPLVYGPGVKANFLSLMRWLRRGWPLPLGAVRNRRTLVALDNLVDLIATCIEHPAAAGQVLLAGDSEDLSTNDLLRRLAGALGTTARLVPVPESFIMAVGRMLGKDAVVRRLCGSLQVDTGKTRALLNWTPPVTVDEALGATATDFLRTAAR